MSKRRPPRRVLLPTVFAVFASVLFFSSYIFFQRLPFETRAYLLRQPQLTSCNLEEISTASASCRSQSEDRNGTAIPNIVNLVYILSDPERDNFPIQFSHFLSIYALWYRWRPETIYIHTNAAADGPAVTRARDGSMGKWSRLFFAIPNLQINTVPVTKYADNGVEIKTMEHKSDFARVKAVHDFGGIYIDLDVHALQDIQKLRESGFRAVTGRQVDGDVNSGTFMSDKGGKMISMWMKRMHAVYDGKWITHSNKALSHVAQQLAHTEPCEVLIMGRDAFAPVGWQPEDNEFLFSDHDVQSNLDGFKAGDALADFEEAESPDLTRLDGGDASWAFDWSCTTLLHAFNLKKPRHGVKHNGITPRYVLERKSNFARAVYPVVKHMYEQGVIAIDDEN